MTDAKIISGDTKIVSDPALGVTLVTPIKVVKDGEAIEGRLLSRYGLTFLDFSQLDPFAFYPAGMNGTSLANLIFEQLHMLRVQIQEDDEDRSNLTKL